MVGLPLLLLAGLAGSNSDGTPAWVREYTVAYSASYSANAHAAIPPWARKYNMNCSGCHYPAPPRLNATGMRFKWAGYRMPEEMNEKVDVTQLSNYVSLRGRMRFDYEKTSGQPASNSSFGNSDATVFYGGPFGKTFGGFFELEREAEDAVELVSNVYGAWGKEKAFGGVRAGAMHWLLREGLAGFDRPTGIRQPIPVNGSLTGSIPFSFAKDQLGVEAFYVTGRNRLSAEILNGINNAGVGDEQDPDTKKDFAVINQLLLDDRGSGVTAVGYYGTLVGADTGGLSPTVASHFWRVGVSANKIVNNFEVLGTVLFAQDNDLPLGGAFSATKNKGMGYWGSLQYTFPQRSLTVYGRYEFLDPNTDVSNDGRSRLVLGGVLPVNLPEYLRFALEYALDMRQASGAPKANGLSAEMMLNF